MPGDDARSADLLSAWLRDQGSDVRQDQDQEQTMKWINPFRPKYIASVLEMNTLEIARFYERWLSQRLGD
jgi:hypothetical protein